MKADAWVVITIVTLGVSESAAATQAELQLPQPLRFSQTSLRPVEDRRQANPAPGQQAIPTTSSPDSSRSRVLLTLDDAEKLALDRNLDIAVQRLNPQTFDLLLAGLRAAYRPSLTTEFTTQSQTNPSITTIAGASAGAGITQEFTTFNGGIVQSVPWGGGNFMVTLNNPRTTTTAGTALFNPSYSPNWWAQYTQPLLRGFSIDSTRQQLVVTKLNQDISELQLQATITNTISNVQNAYWDYVFAVQSSEVAEQSLALADELVRTNQLRVQIGTMAPIEVVQARSQAAAQREALVAAQGAVRTAEVALKRLIVSGTQDPNWDASLDPIDRPDFRPEPVDMEAAIRKALNARTDLMQAQKNVEINATTFKLLRNEVLPQANLVGRYGVAGLGGTQFVSTGSGITRVVTGEIPGGFANALSSLLRQDFPTWNVTLSVSYPLGTSAADAAVARARIQLNQIDAELRQIELQVATDVTNAVVQVQNNIERVQAAQVARALAQQQLDAENTKFGVGMSTNYLVVQAQRDLANARNKELQAMLAYRKSTVEFERVQQTTLQSSNITIVGRY